LWMVSILRIKTTLPVRPGNELMRKQHATTNHHRFHFVEKSYKAIKTLCNLAIAMKNFKDETPRKAYIIKGECSVCGDHRPSMKCHFCQSDDDKIDGTIYLCLTFNRHLHPECLPFYQKEKMINHRAKRKS